jgi:small ligand-binding sensory domain FIST
MNGEAQHSRGNMDLSKMHVLGVAVAGLVLAGETGRAAWHKRMHRFAFASFALTACGPFG